MKFVVFYRRKEKDENGKTKFQLWQKVICESIESVAIIVQNLKVDFQYHGIRENVEIKVFPYIEEGCIVFNLKTAETRIVKSVNYINEFDSATVTVYDTDDHNTAEMQKWGYMSYIQQTWKVEDCVPVMGEDRLQEEGFCFDSAMGKHPKSRRTLD